MPGSGERRVASAPSPAEGKGSSAIERDDRWGAPAHSGAPGGLRVLVVEDEAPLGRATVRLLARDGCDAMAVESAEEALVVLRECDTRPAFDVVVSDVGLPGMSGWQLASVMRSTYPDVAVVFTSGWAGSLPDDAVARLGMSPDDVVSKPYSRDDLRRVLASVASRRDRNAVAR